MSKKLKYLLSSVMAAVGFYNFLALSYESRNYGLMVGVVLVIICLWFGLGIIFEADVGMRLVSVIMPLIFFVGFGMFSSLLSLNLVGRLVLTTVFGLVIYTIFLVENVFMVAIGFRTVPLYRAAYTVSLIILLIACFFLFNTLYSFGFDYKVNSLAVGVLSFFIFVYQFWAITIELPDDGKKKNKMAFTLIPAFLIAQLALVFSFWPVGIFKGSIYLVSAIYVLSSLIQAEIRERLFRRTWLMFVWIGVAIVLGIVLVTRWR